MNTEDPEFISVSPLVRGLTLLVIKSIKEKKYPVNERQVIHTDMVPRFSENVMKATLDKKSLENKLRDLKDREVELMQHLNEIKSSKQKPIPQKPVLKQSIQRMFPQQPLPRARINHPPRRPQIQQKQAPPAPQIQPQQKRPEIKKEDLPPLIAYGKLDPLLHDPSVHLIECIGPNKPLVIMRSGQKQPTRIILSKAEIEQILEKVSEEIHLPLFEGVFRAAVEGFSINAIISKAIGTRFVIKKQR